MTAVFFLAILLSAAVFGVLFTLITIPTNTMRLSETPALLILIASIISVLAGLGALTSFWFGKPFQASKYLQKYINR